MKKVLCAVLAAALLATLAVQGVPARAEGTSRYIAIVYDDSGSMRYDGNQKDVYDNYIYANYALQNFVALMGAPDQANVFLMSDQGEHPFAVERAENLRQSLKRATTDRQGNVTYATAIAAALRSGGAWLREHPDGDFMFVLMTDGDRMFDAKKVDITDRMDAVFDGYARDSGIQAGVARSRAMLFSIGKGQPLPPVTELQAALQRAGMPVSLFSADIRDKATAGSAIVAEMYRLADAMAQTSRLDISSDGAFTAQYPLTSLLLMAQAGADRAGVTAVTDNAGNALTLERLYSVSTAQDGGPTATYYRVRAADGDIKPGAYRIEHSGDLVAFPIVHLKASLVLRSAAGATVAQLSDGQWTPAAVEMTQGDTLQGEVRLAGSDGQAYATGPDVLVQAAASGPCDAQQQSGGSFLLRAALAGEGLLALTLSDQGSFQMALPPLQVRVQAVAAQPAIAATLQPTATAQSAANFPLISEDDLKAVTAASIGFTYTSDTQYRQVAAFTLHAQGAGSLGVTFDRPLSAGLQVRADGQQLDAKAPILTFRQDQPLELSLWVNTDFASGPLALTMSLENGQQMQWSLQPAARKLKLEAQPAVLSFAVLDGAPARSIAWTLSIEQDGRWQPLPTAQTKSFQVLSPRGLGVNLDAQAQRFELRSPALALLSPVGHQVVALSADTGKPGEIARCEVSVDIADSPLKYAGPAAVLLALALLLAYLILLRRKPRLSLNLEVWKSDQPDMQGASRVALRRDRPRRALGPFGRENAFADAVELFAHPRDRSLVILNSTCVQYGLRIDGRGPQYHTDRDQQGDFVLSGDNIFSLREPGGVYVYYRVVHNGEKENHRRLSPKERHHG